MEQTGTNQCLVFVGSMETHVADRMEDYARQNDMNVVDTVFKDDKAIDKLTYYIEREGVICILVRSIWDISTDRETVKSIMKLAVEHNVSINEENRGFEPATLVWDGAPGARLYHLSIRDHSVDEKGSRVVSCPTEDEAREYIREQEGSESDGN